MAPLESFGLGLCPSLPVNLVDTILEVLDATDGKKRNLEELMLSGKSKSFLLKLFYACLVKLYRRVNVYFFICLLIQSYTTPGLGYFGTSLVFIGTKLVYYDTRLVLNDPSLVLKCTKVVWSSSTPNW